MMVRYLPFLIASTLLGADEQIQRLTKSLAEEAAAFQKIAPQLLGRETMQQKAQKKKSRGFPIRLGNTAGAPEQPEWQLRTLVSEYGFTTFADGALHELRRVLTVDDKPVSGGVKGNQGPQELARVITTSDEKRKKELLKRFQEYGLLGAVNDFGQIILLFSPRGIQRYEFTFRNAAIVDGVRTEVFDYRQIDGPNALTVVEAQRDAAQQIRMEGQVWVRSDNYLPLRVTVLSTQQVDDRSLLHEATVNYVPSEHGTLLPSNLRHREVWDGKIVAEHNVRYEDFKRFGASTDIQFAAPGGKK